MGSYVLDFYCAARRLAVEVDGDQHAEATQRAHDEQRTAFLAGLGIRVLRFSNREVPEEREGVLQALWRALSEREDAL